MLPLLGMLGSKIGITAIIITVAVLLVGGFWLYQKNLVSNLRSEIAKKEQEIVVLKVDNEKLKISNESLEKEIQRKIEETKAAYEEILRLEKSDSESRKRLTTIEQRLRDSERKKKSEEIRNSKNIEKALKTLDVNTKCFIENFNRIDGECINGKWVLSSSPKVPSLSDIEDLKEAPVK